ncbi:MAG TPA: ADP-ribosylglycohydrolase family protein [Steroidobacteraceae bacterium]|nr:ADP-ribosylglycohydrolase family protein [Steroidobacteraceae bacterium]
MSDSRTAAVIASLTPPIASSYWVEPERLLAGEHPFALDRRETERRIGAILAAGINYFVDLTQPGEVDDYDTLLPARTATGKPVIYVRKPIVDHDVPAERFHMAEILEYLGRALHLGNNIYLHCRAGIGRTGTVVGCHLVERGATGVAALERLNVLWRANARSQLFPTVPETPAQTEYVRTWRPGIYEEDLGGQVGLDVAKNLRDRFHGALVGLAVGDALGVSVQYRKPGTFTPLGDVIGGGPFELPRGAWSDDTAMALCLADSLLERNGSDPADQVSRYRRWQLEGYLSSTGQCVGITAAVSKALATAQWSGKPHSGSHDPSRLDKEALTRAVAPALFAFATPSAAIDLVVETARTTHQAPLVLDACRYFAGLLIGALSGISKQKLLAAPFEPEAGLWKRLWLKAPVIDAAVASRNPPEAGGGGNVLDALQAVLWAFGKSRNFREGALLAVNLGGDADVTGALYGQLAGAHYGVASIPATWRAAVLRRDVIEGQADRLLAVALAGLET